MNINHDALIQLELVERALEENIIVPLGTGTGKTFIAVMVLRELSTAVRRSLDDGGKRSVFIVDKGVCCVRIKT